MTSGHANQLTRLNFDTSVILTAALNFKSAYLKLKRAANIVLQSPNERVFREVPVLTIAYENQGRTLACIFSATKSVRREKEKTKSM